MGTAQNPSNGSSVAVCPTCQFKFKELRYLREHKCLIKVVSENVEPDLYLKEEGEIRFTLQGLKSFGASYDKIIDFCEERKIVLPGLYPLFFPAQTSNKNSYQVLINFGSVEQSYDLLISAAKVSPVKLRKRLVIKAGTKVLLFETPLLLPKAKHRLKSFHIIDKPDYVVVSVKSRMKCQVGGTLV